MTQRAASLAARYKTGFQHDSEAELKLYLKKHPNADPSKHTVKAPAGKNPKQEAEGGKGKKPPKKEESGGKEQPKPEAEHGEGGAPEQHQEEGHGGEHPEEEPKPKKNFFKSLSDNARSFLESTSKATQKFVADPAYRKKALVGAGKAILKSPQTYARRLVATVKEEVHEFKEAGQALAGVAKGQKLNHHQKKALKTVAIHMGIAITAAALGSTGVLAGAAMLGKGMAQKIALKAAMKSLEKVHLLQEIQHIGHGLHEFMHFLAAEGAPKKPAAEGKMSPEEAFAILVMRSVVQEMRKFSDEDMAEVVEKAAGGGVKTASTSELAPAFKKAQAALDAVLTSIKVFPRMLTAARAEAQTIDERVWQERPVALFKSIEAALTSVGEADELFDTVSLARGRLANIATDARSRLIIPRKAAVEYAISDIDFATNPNTGREGISYSVGTLRDWAGELEKWASSAKGELKTLEQKAARIVRTKGSV